MSYLGRSLSGRAIRYIFFALSGQKRMPLLSLTHHCTNTSASMINEDFQE